MSERLLDHHRYELEVGSGISAEQIAARGYTSVSNPRALPIQFTGRQRELHGLVIPIRDVTGTIATYQIKPDNPWTDPETGRVVKYVTASAGRTCLDVPESVRPLLRNVEMDLWITEGAKKVDSALSNGIPCIIGVTGVWNWKSEGMALPDWDEIALRGRRVIIAYDSDVMMKETPRKAIEALGSYLKMKKAEVRYLVLPALPDGNKCGLDDWFVNGGGL